MEKQKLPKATLTLVFGLLSIFMCLLFGIGGIIFGIAAFVISKDDLQLLKKNPTLFANASTLLIGRILAFIGITISTIYLAFIIFVYAVIGLENVPAWQQNLLDRAQYEQDNR